MRHFCHTIFLFHYIDKGGGMWLSQCTKVGLHSFVEPFNGYFKLVILSIDQYVTCHFYMCTMLTLLSLLRHINNSCIHHIDKLGCRILNQTLFLLHLLQVPLQPSHAPTPPRIHQKDKGLISSGPSCVATAVLSRATCSYFI